MYPLGMTNIAMVKPWPIESSMVYLLIAWWIFPVRELLVRTCHNEMVITTHKCTELKSPNENDRRCTKQVICHRSMAALTLP